MLKIRNNARCVRKYSLSNGVLCASCYCEDKCYLRINVVLKTGEFTDVYSCINLEDFYDELSVLLSVCRELIEGELAK